MATFMAIASAAVLLLAGYLFGIRQGNRAREKLRIQLAEQKDSKIDALLQKSEALQRFIEPLAEWDEHVEKLRSEMQRMQASMQSQDQVSLQLSNLQSTATSRSDLTTLMDEIAEKGQFQALLLSDEDGLPLVSSSNAEELDWLAAIASFVVIFGDRIQRDGAACPIAFLVRDSDNRDILCRIFHVGSRRLVLTAVSVEMPLTPAALDPALDKVTGILLPGLS